MAHRTDAANSTTYGSPAKNIHKDSPAPGTVISAHTMNMPQEEICQAVEDAGLTLAASGAADAAALWGQLKAAIRILAQKRFNEAGMLLTNTDVVITGDSQVITPTVGSLGMSFRLTGTPTSGWSVLLAEASGYNGQVILVTNLTSVHLLVGSIAIPAYIRPFGCCFFKYDSSLSTTIKWVAMQPNSTDEIGEGSNHLYWTNTRFDDRFDDAIDAWKTANFDAYSTTFLHWACDNDATLIGTINALADARIAALGMDSGSFTIQFRGGTSNNAYGSATATWTLVNGLVTICIPPLAFTPSATEDSIKVRKDSDSDFPSPIAAAINNPHVMIRMTVAGVYEVASASVVTPSGTFVSVYRAGIASIASGVALNAPGFMISYNI